MTKRVPERPGVAEVLKKSEIVLTELIEKAVGVPFQLIFGPSIGSGIYVHVGGGIKDLVGISAEDFTEKRFHDLIEKVIPLSSDIPEDPADCRKKMIDGTLKYYKADILARTIEGRQKWINDSSIPLRDEKTGKVIGAFGVLMDITERKQMEQALRESEERFRSLFDRMMDGVYRSTHEGRFVDINSAMVQMFGYSSKEEMLNVDIKKDLYFAPEERDSLFLDIGQVKTEVFRMRRKNGSEIWVEDHGLYVHDDEGKVIFHEGILRDVTERLQAEREIAEWKQRYELVASASRQVVYDYNLVSGTIAWSGSVEQVLGYELTEMDGGVDRWTELIEPDDRDEALRLLEETQKNSAPYDIEYRFRHKNGHYVRIHDLGFFMTDSSGKAARMIGVMQDITDRKRAELLQNAVYQITQAADRASTLEDLFKSVHENIGSVMPAKNFYIALYDAKEDMISFPYFVDEVDVPLPPARPGKGLTEYILRTGKSLLCDEATDAKLRQSGEVELVGVPSPIWLGVPLTVENKTIGVMVVQHYTDPDAYGERELHMLEFVSSQVAKAIEKKRADEQLRQSEEQFRLISENVADMIAVLDLNGKRLYNSPSYKNVLNDPQLLQGTDSFQEIHPEDREKIKNIFQETIRSGVGKRAEYRFITKDGSIRHIESQGSVIKDKGGNVSKVLVVSRDVTEKKNLEQQFLRSQRMESIGTLAGGIAHDLNNVLAPIMLSIEVLQKRITDPDMLKTLETLGASAKRGSDVVKQVLAFSRGIEGERMILQPKHIINEVIKISEETFPKSIEIRSDIPKNLWTISADPTQIHQILLNIFVNARDAMPYGGKIMISAENTRLDENYTRMNLDARPGQYIRISISDTGTGIPPGILDKIFEPFFTTKEIGKGTGLGLSTVLAIVKSHGGFIDVYSEVGKGATFRVYLPAQAKGQEAMPEEKIPGFPLGNNELILVVDDEAPVRDITKDTLEAYGYRVLTANDGAEALAIYAQHKGEIELIITDIMMPILDGTATIRALQKMNPEVKIIAASGMVTNEEMMKSSGVVREFIAKPYTADKLLKMLKAVITSK